jgi:Fic family protein
MQIMLHNAGLIRKSALPISAGLLSDTKKYFAALNAYREGDYSVMTEQICRAALDAVAIGRQTVIQVEQLKCAWESRVKARKDSIVWRALETLLIQPVVDVNYMKERLSVSYPAARAAMNALLDAGILKKTNNKARGMVFEAPEAIKLTDTFAAKIGRRN